MMSAAVRSGCVAAKSIHIGPPSEYPTSAACGERAASITARTSSIRCSSVGMSLTRSESPVPRLSKRINRENEARRCRNAAARGSSQKTSRLDAQPGTSTRSRSLAEHLVGDVDVAAARVPGLGLHDTRYGTLVLGEAEQALGEDVTEDLRGPGADAARSREELVELPLALVRRPRGAVRDLRIRADHLGGDLREVPVHLAPEELGGRALGPGRAAAQDVREASIAVEREGLLADPEPRDLLPHVRVDALLLPLDQTDQPVERVAERDVPNEGQEVSFVRQRGARDAPPFVESAHQVVGGDSDGVEEHLVELRLARDLSERPDGDARPLRQITGEADRKSTRLNSSHTVISYAVFCLKKKKNTKNTKHKNKQ